MSVTIDLNIECDGCGNACIDEDSSVYCEDCYDRLQSTIEDLEAEVECLKEELLDATQEIEDLRDNTEVTS